MRRTGREKEGPVLHRVETRMIVTCPNCSTKFNLPDELASPGANLRCSVCKYVFPLPDEEPESPRQEALSLDGMDDADPGLDYDHLPLERPRRKSGSHKGLFISLGLLVLAVAVAYGTWTYTPLLDGVKKLMASQPEENPADLVKLIALRGVRQYNINNEKIGNISVIEGKTVNGFPDPRELIRVEAALYDAAGNVLVSKQQLAGTSVSLFQLQVLGEQELEQALANKIDILTNNTNVAPGGEVPFMVVFYNPPDNAAEFGVKVIDARLPPAKK